MIGQPPDWSQLESHTQFPPWTKYNRVIKGPPQDPTANNMLLKNRTALFMAVLCSGCGGFFSIGFAGVIEWLAFKGQVLIRDLRLEKQSRTNKQTNYDSIKIQMCIMSYLLAAMARNFSVSCEFGSILIKNWTFLVMVVCELWEDLNCSH